MFEFEVNIISYRYPGLTQSLIDQCRATLPFRPFIRVWENSPEKYEYTGVDELHWMRFNPSLSRVWNWCLAQSQSEWILIASDDIKFREGWYERLAAEVAATPGSFWHGPSRCMLVRRAIVKEIGWFDERLTGFCYEDLDYIRRMNDVGVVHRYGNLSVFAQDAQSLKEEVVRPLYEDENAVFFRTKYADHNSEFFRGHPNFPTPDFYPFSDVSEGRPPVSPKC